MDKAPRNKLTTSSAVHMHGLIINSSVNCVVYSGVIGTKSFFTTRQNPSVYPKTSSWAAVLLTPPVVDPPIPTEAAPAPAVARRQLNVQARNFVRFSVEPILCVQD